MTTTRSMAALGEIAVINLSRKNQKRRRLLSAVVLMPLRTSQNVDAKVLFPPVLRISLFLSSCVSLWSRLNQPLTESKTSHWPFVSCIRWFFAMAPPLQEARSSLESIHFMGEMNVITDDQFLFPIVTKIHAVGPVFHNTRIFQTFWHKSGIFHTQIRGN